MDQRNSTPKTTILDENKVRNDLVNDGISVVSDLIPGDVLAEMQSAFARRLQHQQWNDIEGYAKTDLYRLMISDVLLLGQGFVDVALNDSIRSVMGKYIGQEYVLAEAKGWESLATKRDFHAWHGDAWYDQSAVLDIPKEVKLAIYLTDVTSGHFCYIKGTHQKQHPRNFKPAEVESYPQSDILEIKGKCGTAVLFDTSGIHRQGTPILEPRRAMFYAYHSPSVPLQKEDIEYNRYHPLLLNAAFLGDLDEECRRVLGFGNKNNLETNFERTTRFKKFQMFVQSAFDGVLLDDNIRTRAQDKLKSTLSRLKKNAL